MHRHVGGGGVEEIAGVDVGEERMAAQHLAGLEGDLQVDLWLAVVGHLELQPDAVGVVDQPVEAGLGVFRQAVFAVAAAESRERQVIGCQHLIITIAQLEGVAGQIWQAVTAVESLAHHRAEIDRLAGAVDGPVGVHIGLGGRHGGAGGQAKIPGANRFAPIGDRQAKIGAVRLAQHGIEQGVRIRLGGDGGAEDTLRIGLALHQQAARLIVNGNRQPGGRDIAAQIHHPDEGLGGAHLECRVVIADRHQQRPGIEAVCRQAEAHVVQAG